MWLRLDCTFLLIDDHIEFEIYSMCESLRQQRVLYTGEMNISSINSPDLESETIYLRGKDRAADTYRSSEYFDGQDSAREYHEKALDAFDQFARTHVWANGGRGEFFYDYTGRLKIYA